MNFDQYWQRLQAKNPDLQNSNKMTITTDGFQRAMRQAFEEGRKQGVDQGKCEAQLKQAAANANRSVFGQIFGGP